MFTHSIRTKITALTMAAILVCILSVGGISILSIKSEGDQASAERLDLICDDRCRSIDKYLDSIEQSVDTISRYAGEALDSIELMEGGAVGADGYGGSAAVRARDPERQARLDDYLRSYSSLIEGLFHSVANHTHGVLTYYYRIAPDLSSEVKGFWYSKQGDEFVRAEPTDITNFPEDDISHVGWYYVPLERGRPSWLEPYHNDNLGADIVSYVVPLFRAGTFLGVAGMDVSYDTLVEQIRDIRIYDTGYACLTDQDGTVVYHPTLGIGSHLSDIGPDFYDVADDLRGMESSPSPRRYGFGGTEKMMVFQTLSNGMKLIVTAPVSEINASWTRLILRICLAALAIMGIFAVGTFVTMKRITGPLQRLAAASRLLAQGDYSVELDYDGNDEVGILTSAFQQLVDHLRAYISDLNSKAYQDAMTGVKNKGAYAASAKKLNDAIQMSPAGQGPAFAIVMLDCNDLKKINDQYGHERGDQYLQTACSLICEVFTHSPVFRMGGDEFAVILQHADLDAREELFRRFDRRAAQISIRAADPWERVDIAKGMATYDPQMDSNVENVFHRADEAMYQDKKRRKAARRPPESRVLDLPGRP